MTLNELGKILNSMYFESKEGEAVAMIHLFGIKYAKEINDLNISRQALAKEAGLRKSYGTEISKGVKLEKYVKIK